jgi:flavin reductase (DIM6/NTAB) family NADH-FMN oxidoreductase RutF
VSSDSVVHSDLAEAFREVMGGVATPVSVVTTIFDGEAYGTTVSAFASLSMKPPMVLVALDRNSELLSRLQVSCRFGVNILGSTQAALALAFAGKGGPAKFTGVDWSRSEDLPRLAGVSGWLACELTSLVPGGDHMVALGEVIAAECGEGMPLTYHRRAFGTHACHDDA